MAKALRTNVFQYVGTIGNVIMYVSRNRLCARMKPEKYTDRKSEKQLNARKRFNNLNRFGKLYLDRINNAIWKRGDHFLTAHQYFHKMNSKAFNSAGEIVRHDLLVLSVSKYKLPSELKFSQLEPGSQTVILEWKNKEECNETNQDDLLRMVAIKDNELITITHEPRCRIDQSATFEVPWETWDTIHLYAFFFQDKMFDSTPSYYQPLVNQPVSGNGA